jgi:protein SCO1/2
VRRRTGLVAAAALALASRGLAQPAAPSYGQPAGAAPAGLGDVGIDQRLGAPLPLAAAFRDETGRTVRLGDYFGRRPVLLGFVYYQCPMLCGYVEAGIESALRVLPFTAGKQFDLLLISFDPADLPAMAATKRADFLEKYGRPGADRGVHFLTGPPESIAAVTKAAGFRYARDEETKTLAHAAGVMLATPEGKLSQYFYGIEYSPRDFKFAIMEASKEKIGTPVDRLVLYCSHYDPRSGKYGLVVMRVVRVAGVATVGSIGAFMLVMLGRDRRKAKAGEAAKARAGEAVKERPVRP